jgi:hypothetical protein
MSPSEYVSDLLGFILLTHCRFIKPSTEGTTFSFVDNMGGFMELVNKLATETIIAIDLEVCIPTKLH